MTTYWLSKQLNITFSPYEDRLVLRAQRAQNDMVKVLLTRRMVLIIMQQLVTSLPELTGLNKMPAQYWQEILQIAHQGAIQVKKDADNAETDRAARKGQPASTSARADSGVGAGRHAEIPIYLATELKTRRADKELILAFNGLPMPRAMTIPSAQESIFAAPLKVEHVHQLIELLINKSNEAHWHLPVNLPWLENPSIKDATSLGTALMH